MNEYDALIYTLIFLFTITATVLSGRLLIPILKERAKQPIYEGGPKWHVSKSGTPTMGGITFIIPVTISLFLCALYEYLAQNAEKSLSLIICAVYALLNAAVGIIDDLTKLKHKENAGLTPRAKLIFQFVLSAIFLTVRRILLSDDTSIGFRFGTIDLGFLYYIVTLIILVGICNCANLTDGIDGLASSVAFAIGISSFYYAFEKYETASFISAALIGATVGFLIFNVNPAKVFMGDTGSLFLGSLVAALAIEMQNPLIAVFNGGIYVIEGISVIAQVVFYKITKKRLFKMAPLHHHLEKCGWNENKICIFAMILTFLFSIGGFLLCRV